YDLGGAAAAGPVHTCAFGHRLRSGVGGKATWHPDGTALVYARAKDTPEGFLYSDLYRMDLETEKETRLTTNARAALPAYSPDGRRIAYVAQRDGTTNLFLLDPETGAIGRLTSYADGSQVSDPAWHPSGRWIYFALLTPDGLSRDLWRVDPSTGAAEAVLATEADERSPAFDAEGRHLYFASDASGIFNLYRVPAEDAASMPEPLTNVLGGAFMPAVSASGALAYAHYRWDGYKIALFDATPQAPAALAAYVPPPITQKRGDLALAATERDVLNRFDDTDLRPLEGEAIAAVRTEGRFPLRVTREGTPAPPADGEPLAVEPYGADFTAFSVFPVLRLDQYVSRRRSNLDARLPDRTRGETLLRNTKVGAYVASREVLEGLSLFGGVLVGPASREVDGVGEYVQPSNLLKLERDVFLQFEYKKGLGVLPKRWSPQVSLELFNIRRNVENGLSIEEFPCTACFPDTTLADLSYGLWQADLRLRSKVTRSLLLEAGYRYSPYRVITERFFSKEAQQSIPESSSRYFIGRAFTARAYFEAFHPYKDADVVPRGLRVELGYEYEIGRLLDRFEIEDGLLVPGYQRDANHRLTLDARYGVRLGRAGRGAHGFGARLRATTVVGGAVDDFYNDYVGGLTGARGYPFYALGGNETLWLQASYLVPILPDLRRQLAFLYFDKVYARVYADAAAAWSGPWPGAEAVREDVGAELRLGLGSFYLLPTAVFVSATYGLDAFDFRLDEGFLTPDGDDFVRYGGDVQWHFGVLFGFDL
ncbi:MAG: hypothetical protein R3247_12925, partial [Rhodothermales bacterium]|nr:hypothetical protein [Rhodothermales bacterium]